MFPLLDWNHLTQVTDKSINTTIDSWLLFCREFVFIGEPDIKSRGLTYSKAIGRIRFKGFHPGMRTVTSGMQGKL
jgi:hypothetical protein